QRGWCNARDQRFPRHDGSESLGLVHAARGQKNAGHRTAEIALEIIQAQPEDCDPAFVGFISRTRSASSCSASALQHHLLERDARGEDLVRRTPAVGPEEYGV